MTQEWRTVALRDVLTPKRRAAAILDDRMYEQVTVRIHGRGLASRGVVPGSSIVTKRQFEVAVGDLVTSKIDARNGGFGLVPPELDGAIVSGDFLSFEVNEGLCLAAYLDLYVRRPDFWEECLLVSEGSTNRVRLVPEEFFGLEIDVPPLAEQARIVAAVARVQNAAAAHARKSAAAFAVLRASREKLLKTDDSWQTLPARWSLLPLSDVADIRSGITKGRKTRGDLTATPFIRAANVQDGFLDVTELKSLAVTADEIRRFELKAGDVLMTEGGNAEHVGRGWLWEGQAEPAVAQNHVFRVRPDEALIAPRFLAYSIGAAPARAYCFESAKKTTNLASINKTQISALVIPVPPLDEQSQIVETLDRLRAVGIREMRLAHSIQRVAVSLVEDLLAGSRPAPALPG